MERKKETEGGMQIDRKGGTERNRGVGGWRTSKGGGRERERERASKSE